MLYDEIKGFNPVILNGDLDLIKWGIYEYSI
jgi:hypothetical protein